MTLKQISQFDTSDQDKLGRQLSQLEQNVANETADVRASSSPVPSVVSFAFSKAPAIVAIAADTQLSVDTSAGAVTVLFPPISAKNFGRAFRVINQNGIHPVACKCQDPKALLNGSAFTATLSAAGIFTFYCDSSGYFL